MTEERRRVHTEPIGSCCISYFTPNQDLTMPGGYSFSRSMDSYSCRAMPARICAGVHPCFVFS